MNSQPVSAAAGYTQEIGVDLCDCVGVVGFDADDEITKGVRNHKRCQEITKGVRNRLLTSVGDLGIVELWEGQNDQFRVVGFIMC